MKETTKHFLGDLTLLLVALIWGMGFIAVKIGLNSGMSPFFLLFLRFLIATLLLVAILRKRIKTISKKTWQVGIVLGLFMFFGFSFQTFGLQFTTTSKNAFLTGVNVVIVPYVTFLLTKKKVPLISVIAAFLTLIGIGFLTLDTELTINVGDLLTLVCALLFAFHISVTSIVAKGESVLILVFIQMLTATILSLILSVGLGEDKSLTLPSLLAIIYLGVFSTMVAFVLQTIGQRYAHATKSAILLSTESLFGAVFAVIIFRDPLNVRMVIGAVIIVCAIFLSESDFLKRTKSLS